MNKLTQRENLFNCIGDTPYESALLKVQMNISKLLNENIDDISADKLMEKIYNYIIENNIRCNLSDDAKVLSNHIYHDMAGLSFISREKIFSIPGFEELNINSWNNIHIKINGKSYRTEYSFLSPQKAIDVHQKMLRVKSTVLDKAMPRAVADIGNNIRICASIPPVVDECVGVCSSIRKVSLSTVSLETLVQSETLTQEMLKFLLLCLKFGISMCVSGETGAGKTTLLGTLLSETAKYTRMVTIEEGSREWDFIVKDNEGNPINDVIHKLTRPNDDNPRLHIDQEFLIKDALREDPDIIALGEIRGREAFETMGVSNTGHTTATTVHSNGCKSTAERIVTLAKKAFDMQDSTLYGMFATAFPILVHQEKLADGSRKVTEIYEVLDYKEGEIKYNKLYGYEVLDNIYDGENIEKTIGEFIKYNSISKKLYQRLLKKGAKKQDIVLEDNE